MGKKTILVVDDVASIRDLLAVCLIEFGYETILCENGKDAVPHINHADLIITDFNMPEMNGAELAKLAKGQKPQTPVIIMTGEPWKIPVGHMANQIIEKPFNLKMIQIIVAHFLK